MMTRTYNDILKLQHALSWLGNQRSGEKTKAQAYNALNLRIQLATEAYKPLFAAILSTQKEMFARYELDAGDEIKHLDNGNVSFGAKADREFTRESEALLETPVEDEPKRRAFKLADFDVVGIAVPQMIMDEMGPLLEKQCGLDLDLLNNEEIDVDEEGG